MNKPRTIISLFLSAILVTGTIALSFSSFMTNAQAQSSYTNNYKSKDTNVNINKIKCINDNINVNGNNTGDVNVGNKKGQGYLGANSYGGYYDGYGNNKQGKGFDDCVINNNNNNNNINLVGVGGGNQTVPPEPEPEPTTATLTVNKTIFGCNIFTGPFMDCSGLQNNSPLWISCDNPAISNTNFCTALNENSFDIEVLNASNNQQIVQFEGSAVGTTIPNLQPGTYTVNEIEQPEGNFDNQLADSQTENVRCANQGFPDGGNFFNTTVPRVAYEICFEYEDEQGNDCSTITLAAGEERTCTVKNYIRTAGPPT